MIRADSFYAKGHTHDVNQDYVLHGSDPVPYIIVADGCSSSAHTDLGARLLSWAVLDCIRKNDFTQNEFGNCVIKKAHTAVKTLGIENNQTQGHVLDATLWVCYIDKDYVYINAYGDGTLALKFRNQDPGIVHADSLKTGTIEYSNNAPQYLSYELDVGRKNTWETQAIKGRKRLLQDNLFLDLPHNQGFFLKIPVSDLDMILIATDGLSSFVNRHTQNSINTAEITGHLTNFRNKKGRFLQRRAKRQITAWEKNDIVHNDDIGIACMLFE